MKRNGVEVEICDLQEGDEVSGYYYGVSFVGTVVDIYCLPNYKSTTVRYQAEIRLRERITVNQFVRSSIVVTEQTSNLSAQKMKKRE